MICLAAYKESDLRLRLFLDRFCIVMSSGGAPREDLCAGACTALANTF